MCCSAPLMHTLPILLLCLKWTSVLQRSTAPSLCALQLRRINGVTVYGPRDGAARAALASFNVEGLHATDISSLLDNEGVLAIKLRMLPLKLWSVGLCQTL